MPVMKAVCTPKKMLSPVMILVLISALARIFKVDIASSFSWFRKVTTPRILVSLKKAYRYPLRYACTSSESISL